MYAGAFTSNSDSFPLPLSSSSLPLPVELVAFNVGVQNEGKAILTWHTASETNNAGFQVERRVAGDSSSSAWQSVGFVEGGGTTSNSQSYDFVDDNLPYAADQLSYRLRQVDTDGTTSYSEIRTLELVGPEAITLRAPFPNPTRGSTTLRYALPKAGMVEIEIFDVMGRKVRILRQGAEKAGRKEVHLQTANLSTGVYFVRLRAGATVKTTRFTVVE
jgi:hypothetical protein